MVAQLLIPALRRETGEALSSLATLSRLIGDLQADEKYVSKMAFLRHVHIHACASSHARTHMHACTHIPTLKYLHLHSPELSGLLPSASHP